MLERLQEEDGGAVIEYGIVIAVIALGLADVGQLFVDVLTGYFQGMADEITALDA